MPAIESVDYEQLGDALLSLIYLRGGDEYEANASDTYEVLADYFGLSASERLREWPDGYSGLYWPNRVQWTRQKLINQGYMESRGRGKWGLTPKGVLRGAAITGHYEKSKSN